MDTFKAEQSDKQDLCESSKIHDIPPFVLKHAPLVWLCSKERFWPADVDWLLAQCRPCRQGVTIANHSQLEHTFLTHNLVNDESCYITTVEAKRSRLFDSLTSEAGIPDAQTGKSSAPCWLITVEKSDGIMDAFWFFYYAFNLGPTVSKIHFGNHVSDWEHCMIRFKNGVPHAVHLSSHADGNAYTWECLEKDATNQRPIIYSATGSHAMYPNAGAHAYSPAKGLGPIDVTDKGVLWDPSLYYHAFRHEFERHDHFEPYEPTPASLTHCLTFRGKWGNKFSESEYQGIKQRCFRACRAVKRTAVLEDLRWGDGVTGPRDKRLDRLTMNQHNAYIRESL